MRYGGGTFRSLAACGLAAAVWLACGATAHGQTMRTSGSSFGGGSTGGGSSGFGGGGGQGGGSSLGSSNGFGNSGNGTFSFNGGTSFVGSSSNSFVGGNGGSSFNGSTGSGNFMGSTGSGSFMGSTGSYGGGGGGLRGSASQGISSMNPYRSSFGNVLGSGLGTSTAFGQALYSNLSPTSTNLISSGSSGLGGVGGAGGAGMRGGVGGMGSMGGGTANTAGGSLGALGLVNGSTVVVPLPTGTGPAGPGAALNPLANPAVRLSALPTRMQEDLTSLVSRSDVSPATRTAVTFGLDGGGTLILRGAAANAADARTIENLVRFAPGVRAVRNEMTWR